MRTLSLLAAGTVLTGILVAASAYADNRTLTTIDLKHQLPAQVLPAIKPLLGSGSTAGCELAAPTTRTFHDGNGA